MKLKPRAFIGSSVEGLTVAYALQQNLRHNAEVTVWDQGIFELSSTTMESLAKALESSDFGIFVFSADDITKMRGESNSAVRDNVLFEMGLFLGKLGRERVFFLIPDSGTLHIPSDLLGVTPATFETGRTDGSMQAATGAACHQMRTQIERLGRMRVENSEENLPGEAKEQTEEKREWFEDFIDKKYKEAQVKLEEKLESESGDDVLKTKSWVILCEMRQDEQRGINLITEFANENKKSTVAQEQAAVVLRIENYTDKALELLRSADPSISNSPTLAIEMANCLVSMEEHQGAIDLLIARDLELEPSVSVVLAGILEAQGDANKAIEIVHRCYTKNPNNKQLRYKYARLAQENDQNLIALYLLNELARDEPKNIEYWGYLGNCCLSLNLYDKALAFYRKSEALIGESGNQWIISNIGNLFNNKGLPSEARLYLEKSIKSSSGSEYAHERLAGSMKKQEEEMKEYKKKLAEGLKAIRTKDSQKSDEKQCS